MKTLPHTISTFWEWHAEQEPSFGATAALLGILLDSQSRPSYSPWPVVADVRWMYLLSTLHQKCQQRGYSNRLMTQDEREFCWYKIITQKKIYQAQKMIITIWSWYDNSGWENILME